MKSKEKQALEIKDKLREIFPESKILVQMPSIHSRRFGFGIYDEIITDSQIVEVTSLCRSCNMSYYFVPTYYEDVTKLIIEEL
jgi:predicted transcriptional regulator